MKNAIDKIDRFLERYRQLCFEEGLFIEEFAGGLILSWIANKESEFNDSLERLKNETLDNLNNSFYSSNKWRELDK